MIMEVAIVWLLCAAIFLELADRAPIIEMTGRESAAAARQAGEDRPESVAAEALSLKTATRDPASS